MTIRRFRGGASAARCARRVVREELEGALPRPKLADVELLVSELATNSVRHAGCDESGELEVEAAVEDRKSTRLNSSHANISYAVFCLEKKTQLAVDPHRGG